jgi:hypothetical protein
MFPSEMPDQLELGELGDALEVQFDKNHLGLIMKLLEQTTGLDVVKGFLKAKGVHFSAGSWAELHKDRIIPAIRSGAVTVGELITLLAEAEEYGSTHSFLYKCSSAIARQVTSEATVKNALKKMGLLDLLDNPRVLDQPATAEVVSARWDADKRGRCLVAKVIERRFRQDRVKVVEKDNEIVKHYTKTPVRSVNVIRLYVSGLLELRVQAYSNSSNYEKEADGLWSLLAWLFPPAHFEALSLSKAKQALWSNRAEFDKVVRFSDSTVRDDQGGVATVGTGGEQANLFSNKGATECVNTFLKHGAYCDGFNVWWVKQKNGLPSKDIHMMLLGKPNEFAVTTSCAKDDFEYTFDRLYGLC